MKGPTRLAVAVVAGALAWASHARAQLATLDFTNLIQNTSTALNTAQQVKQTYELVINSAKQVEYQLQNLKRVDPTSFQGVVDTFNQGRMAYATYHGTKATIGYQADSVRTGFETLFPGLAQVRNTDPATYAGSASRRQGEMREVARTAMGAQANQAQLQENARLARVIAAKSQSAPGEVAQMQLVIESLLVVQNQLSVLTSMISASERLNATAAANAATNSLMAEEMNKKVMAGYTNRGAPPRPRRIRR